MQITRFRNTRNVIQCQEIVKPLTDEITQNCQVPKAQALNILKIEKELESIWMVKPWNSVRIKFGLDLRGPDIRPDFDNRLLIIEGHRGLRR